MTGMASDSALNRYADVCVSLMYYCESCGVTREQFLQRLRDAPPHNDPGSTIPIHDEVEQIHEVWLSLPAEHDR